MWIVIRTAGKVVFTRPPLHVAGRFITARGGPARRSRPADRAECSPFPRAGSTEGSSPVPTSARDRANPARRAPRSRIIPRLDRREAAALFIGGALGTLLRAALSEAFPQSTTS